MESKSVIGGCGSIVADKGIVDSNIKALRNKINGTPDVRSFMAAPKGGLYSTSPFAVTITYTGKSIQYQTKGALTTTAGICFLGFGAIRTSSPGSTPVM